MRFPTPFVVRDRVAARQERLRKPDHVHHDDDTLGNRVADAVARFIGSWRFVFIQTGLMILWVSYNAYVAVKWLHTGEFDPFPFVFLNLFMSAEAAYSTPLIMMSQNRQADKDRRRDDVEAEEVAELHRMNRTQLRILWVLSALVCGQTAFFVLLWRRLHRGV